MLVFRIFIALALHALAYVAPAASPASLPPIATVCLRPRSAPYSWEAATDADAVFIKVGGCVRNEDDDRYWTMLSAYRSGSPRARWKYTDDIDDPECLQSWTYYNKKGDKVIGRVIRTTSQGYASKRLWCPLPRTSKSGEEGKLWVYCNCTTS